MAWKFHAETALPHPSCPFVVKDLNKDGRLDIIFGRGHDVGLYWWEQQSPKADGTTMWKQHVIFLCRSCGHFDHADVVGATNIACAAKVAWREVAEQRLTAAA